MAKKTTPAPSKTPAAKAPVAKAAPAAATATPVRNTPIPKVAAPVRKEVTHEMIAQRAYEIHLSGQGGSDVDNWHRAERELRGL
jgi:hypothetical protein